jgi:DNA-binding transcriptional LysR family regulator
MRILSASKLKAFQVAARTGSFKRTAQLLSISASAVSARVRSLELELGVTLFRRAARQLSLTDAGAHYLRDVEMTFLSLEMATQELRQRFTSGHPARPD